MRNAECGMGDGSFFPYSPFRIPHSAFEACRKMKGAALAEPFALHPDSPSHHPDELLRDRQAQPRASILPRRRAIRLLERLEDQMLLLRRNPNPRITHRKLQPH